MPPDPAFMAKSPAASPFLAGFEPTTFRLGGGRSILLSYRNIYEFFPYFQGFWPLRSGYLSCKSSKISTVCLMKTSLISDLCWKTHHTPFLDIRLILALPAPLSRSLVCFQPAPKIYVWHGVRSSPNFIVSRTVWCPEVLDFPAFPQVSLSDFPNEWWLISANFRPSN